MLYDIFVRSTFIGKVLNGKQKTRVLFNKLNIDITSEQGLITVSAKNTKAFFYENINTFNSSFNELERNDIKVFIEYLDGSKFNYQSMFLAKPLQRFINIIEDKEYVAKQNK